ncbi:hypothetical protein TNCV_4346661 [Trichonephila clavipes]|nr:hypothetical protein TNCV_4346661 [Trichonephila clavipes]
MGPRRRRRARRQDKLKPISKGDPGDMSLDPRHDSSPLQAPLQQDEDSSNDPASGRIDIKVPTILASFAEPLDTLLGVDEISDRKSHFEAIVEGITVAVVGNDGSCIISRTFSLCRYKKLEHLETHSRKTKLVHYTNTVQRIPVRYMETHSHIQEKH